MAYPEATREKTLTVLAVLTMATSTLFSSDAFAWRIGDIRFAVFDVMAGVFILLVVLTRTEHFRVLNRYERTMVLGLFLLGLTGFLYSLVAVPMDKPWFNHGGAIADGFRYVLFAGVVVAVLTLGRSTGSGWGPRKAMLNSWLVIAGLVVILGALQVLGVRGFETFERYFIWSNVSGGGTRIASTFVWQGSFVAFMGASLPLVAAKYVVAQRNAMLWGALYVAGVIVVLYSGSRSAILVLPFSVLPLLTRIAWSRTVKLVGLSIAGLLLMLLVAPSAIELVLGESAAVDRALGQSDSGLIRQNEFRVRRFEEGVDFFWGSPVGGIGPRQFEEVSRRGTTAHSGYLALLVERGLVGLVLGSLALGPLIMLSVRNVMYRDALEGSSWVIAFSLCCGVWSIVLYNTVGDAMTYRWFWVYAAMACQSLCGSHVESKGSRSAVGFVQPSP